MNPSLRTNPKRVKAVVIALALAWCGLAVPASAATYVGTANVPSVIWISGAAPAPPSGAEIHQTDKAFVPALLVIPAGTSVRFPNDDPFYHSVYSDSPSNPFDLGLYDTGPGKDVVFANPGIVEIHCHVHGSMHATVVVVDGPFAVTTVPNQRYRISGVARGVQVLHVWAGGTDATSTSVRVR